MCKGINGRDYLQFITVRQLRVAVSEVYSETPTGHKIRYSLKSHPGSVLHMYEGSIQSVFMEIFAKETKRRMLEDSDWNKPVNSLVVNYILNHIRHKWVMLDTEPFRKRELLTTAAYICVTYGYYLQGYNGLCVDCQQLIDGITIGNYDRRETHVSVLVMGIFKMEDGNHMHLILLINVTQSGIGIRVWLEILVALSKA